MILILKFILLALVNVSLTNAVSYGTYKSLGSNRALSERDQKLAELTGSTNLTEIQQAFQQVFRSSDIDRVLKLISKVTKQQDPISFLWFCIHITQTETIQDASTVFLHTTTRKMRFIDVLKTTARLCGHDLKDFYLKIVEQTASRSLGEAFEILRTLTGLHDIFAILQSRWKYTFHKDPIEMHEIEIAATHSATLQEAYAKICFVTSTNSILQAYDIIKEITKEDITKIFKVIGSFEVDSWTDFVKILTKYTRTTDFVSAMKSLKDATGEKNAIDAMKHIQQGYPDAFKTY